MKTSLLLLALSALTLSAEDWPRFLGPKGNATSSETKLLKTFPKEGPEILWETEIEGGFGGAAIVGNEIFIGDRIEKEKDLLLCLDLKTGEKKWSFEHPSEGEPPYPGSRSVPTVEDDAIYFLGAFGEVFRINRETHKADWAIKLSDRYPDAKTPTWGYAQCALIVGDAIIVTPFGSKTGIAAWDKKTGKELWKSGPIGDSHSSPTLMTIDDQLQIVLITAGDSGGLQSYHPETGEKLWSTQLYQNRIPITIPIQIDKNRIFVTGGYRAGSAMLFIAKVDDSYEIDELWSTKKGSQVHPPIVIDDHLYFLANENSNYKTATRRKKGGLVCFDLEGKELWSTGNAPFMGRGGSLYADGMLIIQDGEKGVLRLIDPSPKKYELLAKANIFKTDLKNKKDLKYWSPLALSNGTLVMRGQGKLIAVNLKKK